MDLQRNTSHFIQITYFYKAAQLWEIAAERPERPCLCCQAELNDVLEDDEDETPAATPPAATLPAPKIAAASHATPPAAPAGATGLESRLLERIDMYKTAIANAKAAGEASKVRRYDRGLKVRWRRCLVLLFVFGCCIKCKQKKKNGSTHLFSVSLVEVLTGWRFLFRLGNPDSAVLVNICQERKTYQ